MARSSPWLTCRRPWPVASASVCSTGAVGISVIAARARQQVEKEGRADQGRENAQRQLDARRAARQGVGRNHEADRKSTRLNSSHSQISYAVFCLKKKT